MTQPPKSPFEETVDNQRLAADPARSAFVAANAGSGKTRVLTERVARLLLTGVAPSRILCITYTKAAAAEMAHRLFNLLGEWALADDASLGGKLDALEGGGRTRTPDDYAAARRLFARALETPGGLKIQTIHSFCESVLKRFPLEAGVPPGFQVIDETSAASLAAAAADAAALEPALAPALDLLSARYAPGDLRGLIAGALLSRQKFDDARAAAGGFAGLDAAIAKMLGVKKSETAGDIRAAFVAGVSDDDIARARGAMFSGAKTCKGYAENELADYLNEKNPETRYGLLLGMLLTQAGTPRQKFPDAGTKKADPWTEGFFGALQDKAVAAEERIRAAGVLADTVAFLSLVETALQAYTRLKAARAALDYDDLIAGALGLFASADAGWVRYKLDQGLDHILLDEAQDTGPAQWRVVEGPLEEFFAGQGARDEPRTFFAVGDQKQSIYSFQGADAGLFAEKQQDLGKRIDDVAPFENVPLTLSFRTAAPVLDFVDALFAADSVREGVGDDKPLKHGVYREKAAGLVELWPRTPPAESEAADAWEAPVDAPPADNPVRRLTLSVCEIIAGWLKDGEILLSQSRPIKPGDIMILVQSRGPLFHEMIRALSGAGVPIAGADKIQLLEDPGVEDLLSFARAAVFAGDDLSLAETLKSPFFSLDETSLFDLAYGREGSLWRALSARADERPEWRRARDGIAEARRLALKDGAFAFFSHVLETGAPVGRKRLYARLGEPVAEPVEELLRQALDYEQANPRSLQGFLIWAAQAAGEIKRDMEEAADAVRVMTVHGAKGLEAPVVFLLDAHRRPNLRHLGPVFFNEPERLPLLSANAAGDSAVSAAARETAKRRAYEEYRRLLYVAATRARDRLYICGLTPGNEKNPHGPPPQEKSWHALAEDAFQRLDNVKEAGAAPWGGTILRHAYGGVEETEKETQADEPVIPPAPAFFSSPAPTETARPRLAPSRLADLDEAASEPAAYSPVRSADAFLRGRALHRLLELLPERPPESRAGDADRLLARLAGDIGADERARWRDEALAVIADPAFAPVFAPASRAEVAIAGVPKGARADFFISGQIDRLAVENGRVLIVDYKTNRPPPARVEDASPAYIAQLAAYRALLQEIYPDHQIEAALLWTYDARLMAVPPSLLDHAFARVLA